MLSHYLNYETGQSLEDKETSKPSALPWGVHERDDTSPSIVLPRGIAVASTRRCAQRLPAADNRENHLATLSAHGFCVPRFHFYRRK